MEPPRHSRARGNPVEPRTPELVLRTEGPAVCLAQVQSSQAWGALPS